MGGTKCNRFFGTRVNKIVTQVRDGLPVVRMINYVNLGFRN